MLISPEDLRSASYEALIRLRDHLLAICDPPIKEKKLLRMIARELIRRGI